MRAPQKNNKRAATQGFDLALFAMIAFGLAVILGTTLAGPAQAEGCSATTEQVREEQLGASLGLADCRAYEQVSPTAKNGLDTLGGPYTTQVSTTGDRVSFYSLVPFPGLAGSSEVPTYISIRNAAWTDDGLQPQSAPGSTDNRVLGLTEDLARTIMLAQDPPLAAGALLGGRNAYIRENTTGGVYKLLAPNVGAHEIAFVDAGSGDRRILFETTADLTTLNAKPASEFTNLYEWNEGMPAGERVSLAGIVPPSGKAICGDPPQPACVAPKKGSVGGPGGPLVPGYSPVGKPGGSIDNFYTQNTVSRDGAHVFFTDVENGFVYMRDPLINRTVMISAGIASALWQAATPNGAYAFYTEGGELYRFNIDNFEKSVKPTSEALAEAREQITDKAEGVLGMFGVSDDGSYAYFVAPGVVASNKNGHGEEASQGAFNLYEWHENETTFIARLMGSADQADWRGSFNRETESDGPAGGNKSSRVAPSGKTILFSSEASLTTYPSNGKTEFYLYDSESALSPSNPVCVSCNPNGLAPTSPETRLSREGATVVVTPHEFTPFLTHNLSDSGDRVFFQSEEALVRTDSNQQLDVYEWERMGTGSCTGATAGVSEQDGGCLYLISSGRSPQVSYFGNADDDGNNAFFFTRDSLVSQDNDENSDLYDARVEGGLETQNSTPPRSPCGAESTCRGAPSTGSSVFATPISTTFSGSGNLPVQALRAKPLTRFAMRAEKLTKALKVCRSKPRLKRRVCELKARKRYGSKSRARKAGRGGVQS